MFLPIGVVENADLVLVQVVRHALGVAPVRRRPLHNDAVIAGENASNLALALVLGGGDDA
jgi:hypothetical protein